MLELMVAGLCVGQYGCDKALSAYYHQAPAIQRMNKHAKMKAIEYVGKEIVFTLPVVYAAFSDKRYALRFTKNWSLAASHDDAVLRFRYDF